MLLLKSMKDVAQFLSALAPAETTEDQQAENKDACQSEIESLEVTLQPDEYQTAESEGFALVTFSVIPALSGSITAKNTQKKTTADFRSLPAFEFTLALSGAYPGQEAPHLMIKSDFYQQYTEQICEELKSRWSEGCPVLYAYFDFVQNEMVDFLGLTDSSGNICLEIDSDQEFFDVQ
jgi:hypothetical protein